MITSADVFSFSPFSTPFQRVEVDESLLKNKSSVSCGLDSRANQLADEQQYSWSVMVDQAKEEQVRGDYKGGGGDCGIGKQQQVSSTSF